MRGQSVDRRTNYVFNELAKICPGRFFKGKQARQSWDEVLKQLTAEQADRGIQAVSESDGWEATCGGFLRLALGFPDVETCVGRVIDQTLSDRVSYLVAEKVKSASDETTDNAQTEKLAKCFYHDCYQQAVREALNTGSTPAMPVGIGAGAVKPEDQERYESLLRRAKSVTKRGKPYTVDASRGLDVVSDELESLEWDLDMEAYSNG